MTELFWYRRELAFCILPHCMPQSSAVRTTPDISLVVHASSGSVAGGHRLLISGTGFSDTPGLTEVSICDLPCDIAGDVSSSMIECTTNRYWQGPAPVSEHGVLTVLPHQVKGSGTFQQLTDNPASKMFDGEIGSAYEWRYVCYLAFTYMERLEFEISADCVYVAAPLQEKTCRCTCSMSAMPVRYCADVTCTV